MEFLGGFEVHYGNNFLKVIDMEQLEFEEYVNRYNKLYTRDCRSASFDICYGYFQTHKGEELKADIGRACLVLWSYLASYGMLRGSNKVVLYKNPFYLKELIGYIADNDLSGIDVSDYDDDDKLKRIISAYKDISKELRFKYQDGMAKVQEFVPSVAFITKVMLGVYSCVPAFDTFFCEFLKKDVNAGCVFCEETLRSIKQFFESDGINPIDQLVTYSYSETKNESFKFNFARQVDMYGFEKGKEIIENSIRLENVISDTDDFLNHVYYVSNELEMDPVDLEEYLKILPFYVIKSNKFVREGQYIPRKSEVADIKVINSFDMHIKKVLSGIADYLYHNSINYGILINNYESGVYQDSKNSKK